MRKVILGAAAAAMLAGSSMAQAAPVARVSAPAGEAEGLGGRNGAEVIVGIIALILVGVLVFAINDDEDENVPTSP